MNKDQLQQDLLKNIKPGVKPSDLKKKNNQIPTPPDSPIITSIDKKPKPKPAKIPLSPPSISIEDEGYVSEEATNRDKSPLKNPAQDKLKQLQEQVNFWQTTASNYLTSLQLTTAELDQAEQRIKECESKLKTKPETITQAAEQALIEANQKIREQEQIIKKEQEKVQAKDKTISELKKQAKNPTKDKETKEIGTQTEPILFYCNICQQNKHGNYLLRQVDSPFEPRTHQKLCYVCSTCRKYTKELAEVNWKEKDNPYKLYD